LHCEAQTRGELNTGKGQIRKVHFNMGTR